MIHEIEKRLSGMTAAQLAKIVMAALDTMGTEEQNSFIARHIDAGVVLARLNADEPSEFLDAVEKFCLLCLSGEFYSDEEDIEAFFAENDYRYSYYDDDWDYDEYYSNLEWTRSFSNFFELSMMHIRKGDIATGYEANTRLLSCLEEARSDEGVFGMDEPLAYIDVDWKELAALHCQALFKYHEDQKKAINEALCYWDSFGSSFEEGLLDNVRDLALAESCLLDKLRGGKRLGGSAQVL